jgi:hypothetical protein
MKRAFAFWIPFGDLMHQEQAPGGAIWAKGCGCADWWINRAKIFKEFTQKSLLNMKLPNAEVFIVIGLPWEVFDLSLPVREALSTFYSPSIKLKVILSISPATDTLNRGQSPTLDAVRRVFSSTDADTVTFIHLDSDDMYASSALADIVDHPSKPGLTLSFRTGFLFDANSQKLFEYDPKLCPPPFFARNYSRSWLDHLKLAEQVSGFLSFHHELLKKSHELLSLPDGKFCVVVHGGNTSSTMQNPAIQSKLINEIKEEHTRRNILRTFGYELIAKDTANA